MANTTKESFSSNTDVIPISEATQVFSGSVTFTANEWTTIELGGEGFGYEGDNLAIIVDDNSGNESMGSTNWAVFNTTDFQALCFHRDNDDINPSSPSASENYRNNLKNQLQLGIVQSATPKPKNLEVSNITSSGATLTWIAPSGATPSGYQYQYKSTGGWPTDWDDVNGLTVTLNTLSASSDYTFRVKAIYGGVGESGFVETTFTTPCEVITLDGTQSYTVNLKANTIADCWSQTEGTYPWSFSSDNGATFTFSTSDDDELTSTRLISPVFSFGEGSYRLSFTGELYGDHYEDDLFTATLKIYYRTSSTGEWQPLGQPYPAIGVTRSLDESEILLHAGTCQLAFKATSEEECHAYLYGIGITKVPSLINTYEVTVTANPAEGGTVTGGGTYNDGTTATLTATASTATGYTFSNWTKAGDVVSTNATYTVTVTEAGEYVANFTLNTQTLTVHYQYEDGVAVGDDTVKQVNIGSTYNVVSPVMDCYVADKVRKKQKKGRLLIRGAFLLISSSN